MRNIPTLVRVSTLLIGAFLTYGCASVPMASADQDAQRKLFAPPPEGMAGLYIYRDTTMGGALKKTLFVDGQPIGESGPKTYFYRELTPGSHVLATESEFGNNDLLLEAAAGTNYFVDQKMKLGVTVYGAYLKLVPEAEGRKGVMKCKLAN
jgi:hypothetical protein